jgi:hypothetical protein
LDIPTEMIAVDVIPYTGGDVTDDPDAVDG